MVVEALTGRRPFVGRTPTELMASILRTPFHLTGESADVQKLDGYCKSAWPKTGCNALPQ
jgi:hypothetical protein